jgi:hypothetical protein
VVEKIKRGWAWFQQIAVMNHANEKIACRCKSSLDNGHGKGRGGGEQLTGIQNRWLERKRKRKERRR